MTYERELKTAQRAALAAGHFLAINKGCSEQGNISGRDVKLKADKESEAIILDILTNFTESYSILAEESGEIGEPSKLEPMWVIDPLDGTVNYSRDMDVCCVSIALYQGLNPILGVIYDFTRNELFSGLVNKGADCNGRSIKPSMVKDPGQAILATGFPVNRDFGSASLKVFLNQIQQFKKLRLLGSAAISLAYVACGRVDAYMEEDIMFWDVAAGLAIAQAAGAYTSLHQTNNRPWAMVAQSAGKNKLFAL